jgi:hypothetical protein
MDLRKPRSPYQSPLTSREDMILAVCEGGSTPFQRNNTPRLKIDQGHSAFPVGTGRILPRLGGVPCTTEAVTASAFVLIEVEAGHVVVSLQQAYFMGQREVKEMALDLRMYR